MGKVRRFPDRFGQRGNPREPLQPLALYRTQPGPAAMQRGLGNDSVLELGGSQLVSRHMAGYSRERCHRQAGFNGSPEILQGLDPPPQHPLAPQHPGHLSRVYRHQRS